MIWGRGFCNKAHIPKIVLFPFSKIVKDFEPDVLCIEGVIEKGMILTMEIRSNSVHMILYIQIGKKMGTWNFATRHANPSPN